jgi:hypothetical protein
VTALCRQIGGGKFNLSKPPSSLDLAIRQGMQSPGPGEYNSELTSIGRRSGRMPYEVSQPSIPPEQRPKTASSGIPPEARRTPKPKDQLHRAQEPGLEKSPARPQTSHGIPKEARGKMLRPESAPRPLPPRAVSAEPRQRSTHSEGTRARTPARQPKPSPEKAPPSQPDSAERSTVRAVAEVSRPQTVGAVAQGAGAASDTGSAADKGRATHSLQKSRRAAPARAQRGRDTRSPLASTFPAPVPRTPAHGSIGRPHKRIPRSVNKRASARSASVLSWEGRGQLSENARTLFDLAMQSDEFRKLMQMYTGASDPTPLVEKYAATWTVP